MKQVNGYLILVCSISTSLAGTKAYADCTEEILSGSYVATNQGTIFDDRLLTVGQSIFTFDGQGNYTNANSLFMSQGRGAERPGTATGTYQVNPDCTGTITAANGNVVELVISFSGDEAHGIVIPPSTQASRVVTWMFKRQ